MRALQLHTTDGPSALRIDEIETPQPAPGEVRVRLLAAALNRRDLYVTQGLYPNIALPVVLGSDGCGVVDALGADVRDIDLDARVVINPMLDWGGDEGAWDPSTANILGMPHQGTLAEYVCVPANNIYAAPSTLSDEEAAALPLAGLTAYRALVTRGRLRAGERVLLPGIGGGVQTFALLFAKAMGAHVVVTSGSDEKLERARALGADETYNYRSDEAWFKTARKTPVDLVVDSSGGDTLQHSLECVKTGGRVVIYGGTRPQATIRLFSVFWKHVDVLGTSMGSPHDFRAMLAQFDGSMRPVVDHTYSLANGAQAVERLAASDQFGKIVVRI